MKELIEKYKQ